MMRICYGSHNLSDFVTLYETNIDLNFNNSSKSFFVDSTCDNLFLIFIFNAINFIILFAIIRWRR